jgi:hypothetical protein
VEKHLKYRDEKGERYQREKYGKDVKKNVKKGITPIRASIT